MSMPEIYLLFLLFSFFLFVGIKIFSFWINKPSVSTIDLNEVSFVIPFRNEENNLDSLLESISKQKGLPYDIIFINDHSDDKSVVIVQSFIDDFKIGKLYSLSGGECGKKAALAIGIQKSETRLILTLDADVVLNEDYMYSLQNLKYSGLSSLPVRMNGKGFFGRLFSTEYSFFNAFNYLLAPIWPISISGANLLFDSKLVDYNEQLKNHQHLASGDDYFLMKKYRSNNLPIHISNDYRLSVITAAPISLKSYFNQRVRWLTKSKHEIIWIDSLIGLFILLYFLGGIVALVLSLMSSEWLILGSIFILRFLIDALIYLNYGQRLREAKNVLILPFFQLIYPLLLILVGLLSLFYKPDWKGRRAA